MNTAFTTRRRRRLTMTAIAMPIAVGLMLTGCATAEQATGSASGETGPELDADAYTAAVAKAKEIAGDEELGGSIEYMSQTGGSEGAILEAVYAAFTEATGTEVNYTGTQDLNSLVQSRVQAGNAPDIADLSVGIAKGYAEDGDTVDLTALIGEDELAANYPASLLDSASVDGSVFGIYQGFSNFMVWYNPAEYTGPEDPTAWSELADWTDEQAAAGTPTWCIAEESGAGSGFPGAQMIETIFAKKYGPELETQWGEGTLPWTSPEVKDAFEIFGDIAADDSKVYGGVTGSLAQGIAAGPAGLTTDPVQCQVDLWASWVPGMIPDAVAGETLDFFQIPASNPEFQNVEIYQSTVSTVFNENEQTSAFITWLASTEAQTLLASADHWTVSNVNVPSSTYSNTLLQKAADTYFSDDVILANGPNVLADTATGAAFWAGVVAYLQDPSSLDTVLQTIEDAS